MGTYSHDRAFSDRFIPELRRLIGPFLLMPSSLEQDRKEAADLVVLKARDMTIACRVRRPGYADRYPRQFTMRLERRNGIKTEYRKVIEGWGDWFFYGHAVAERESCELAPWWLIDLSAFRAHLISSRKQIHFNDVSNRDKETAFRSFEIDSFPSDPILLVSESQAATMPEEPTANGVAMLDDSEIPW